MNAGSQVFRCDFLIIGGGIAGLSAAIEASHHGTVILLTKGKTGETATEYAQGGIAAAVDEQKDSPLFHMQDTLDVGAGLSDENAVKVLVNDGVKRVHELIKIGVKFDKIGDVYELALEGAHSHRRILHAGDATGSEIERGLAARLLKEKLVDVRNFIYGKDLLIKNGRCIGAEAIDIQNSRKLIFLARSTMLATGGLGQVYLHNTNPSFATGDGIAMAYRAGAEVSDMEFVQFHPTTLFIRNIVETRFLISEAVRGEGAVLENINGERFMPKYHLLKDLAPRDIVSRSILVEMNRTNSDHVYLNLAPIGAERIGKRFPKIYQECLKYNIDITKDKIPVTPAAHYFMGGVKIDTDGNTNIPGLYAAGEVSSAGVHGANRLASNSLLDGLVFGYRAAVNAESYNKSPDIDKAINGFNPSLKEHVPPKSTPEEIKRQKQALKTIMWEKVGIVRREKDLKLALSELKKIGHKIHYIPDNKDELELKNMATASILIAQAALNRKESRGAHFRSDYPLQDDIHWRKHQVFKKRKLFFPL
jgi:L-aspartate oxidase